MTNNFKIHDIFESKVELKAEFGGYVTVSFHGPKAVVMAEIESIFKALRKEFTDVELTKMFANAMMGDLDGVISVDKDKTPDFHLTPEQTKQMEALMETILKAIDDFGGKSKQ